MKKNIVITGMGLVTSLGINVTSSWNNIIHSRSGIKKIPQYLFDASDLASKIAGYIATEDEDNILGLNVAKHLTAPIINATDRFIQLGIIAANEAIHDAQCNNLNEDIKQRVSIVVGAGIGGLMTIERNAKILNESGPRRVSPFFVPASLINLISGQISIKYGFKGANFGVVSACATGAHSIIEGISIIQRNEADIVICGGAEAAVCRLGMAGFAAARALSTKYNDIPESASRPWSKSRDGFVMGEGAGVLVLESIESAKKRDVKIYGEVIGYGSTADAYHITSPDTSGEGAYKAMCNAIEMAKVSHIDYINAHGTSTPAGDIVEYQAVERMLNKYNFDNIAMSSTKSSIGHLLGAAGSVEAIFCLMAINNNIVPPTLNLYDTEDICKMNLVPHIAQDKNVQIAMSNSFGFGGTNVSLIFKKI